MKGAPPILGIYLYRTNEDLGRNKNLYLPVPKSNWLARCFTYMAGQD